VEEENPFKLSEQGGGKKKKLKLLPGVQHHHRRGESLIKFLPFFTRRCSFN
jgi:hypothetical protein